jgi:tetratricopeptide (TPR) repeat protein
VNIAQRNQAKIKAKIAAGENVAIVAPNYADKQVSGANAAQRFREKVLAKAVRSQRKEIDSEGNSELNKEYDIIKASLDGDLVTLKGLKTIPKKLAYKAHVIPNYLGYLETFVAEEHEHPNGILSQVIVWLFDTQQFELAQKYADVALAQGQKLPARFKTPNFETFICDELCVYANNQLKNKQPAPALQYAIDGINNEWDVNKVLTGKIFVVAGKLAHAAGDLETAVDYFTKALEINDRAGVKKLRDELIGKLAGKTESESK